MSDYPMMSAFESKGAVVAVDEPTLGYIKAGARVDPLSLIAALFLATAVVLTLGAGTTVPTATLGAATALLFLCASVQDHRHKNQMRLAWATFERTGAIGETLALRERQFRRARTRAGRAYAALFLAQACQLGADLERALGLFMAVHRSAALPDHLQPSIEAQIAKTHALLGQVEMAQDWLACRPGADERIKGDANDVIPVGIQVYRRAIARADAETRASGPCSQHYRRVEALVEAFSLSQSVGPDDSWIQTLFAKARPANRQEYEYLVRHWPDFRALTDRFFAD